VVTTVTRLEVRGFRPRNPESSYDLSLLKNVKTDPIS